MKKIIYTAIAVVAFVGSSMANTIEVPKETKIKKTSSLKKAAKPLKNRETICKMVAFEVADALADIGCSGEMMVSAYHAAYTKCMN